MGSCGSKPVGCIGFKGKLKLQKKRGKRQRNRRVKKSHSSVSKNRVEPSNQSDLSYSNPAFQGVEESWSDRDDDEVESDCEDEFYSVQDDLSQAGSISTVVTPRFSSIASNEADSQLNFDDPRSEAKSPAFAEKSRNEPLRREESGSLHSCGFLASAFLPCLACDETLDVKKKTSSLPSFKKKLSLTPSFKWREGGSTSSIVSLARAITERPIAGSQIRCSPLEKQMTDCWSRVEPSIFKVRGQNFCRDKKKECASNNAAYVPFGVDVFLSPRKINHIAQHVELPAFDTSAVEIPTILIVNLQMPLYPASLFQSENDGEGMNYVFYFKLSESYSEDLPLHFRENIKRVIANDIEKIKGFPMDSHVPFRERLKIVGRVVNVEDLQLSGGERKLMQAYNEKPVLSRPQHEFYSGENYMEIDLDIHRFSYIARKGFETFQDRIKHCVFDFGLTIQGNKPEDLPECMLCCLRLKEIDYSNCCQLSL